MKTIFVGHEEVRGYLRDLLGRLNPTPTVWCPITQSGRALVGALAKVVGELRPELLSTVRILKIDINASDDSIQFDSNEDAPEAIRGNSVLLLDGAIHSGSMISRCADAVIAHKPASLSSYALVVKRQSMFIPTCWGVMTDETDRAHFLLDDGIPNNRLHAGTGRPTQPVHIRRLDRRHASYPPLVSGVKSIDRVTWSDRLYGMETTEGLTTYLLKVGELVVGFLTVQIASEYLTVAEIVSSPLGYGGILMRFADTLARQSECKKVRLNAIKDRIEKYTEWRFEESPGRPSIRLDDEEYQPMERDVLYHHTPEDGH